MKYLILILIIFSSCAVFKTPYVPEKKVVARSTYEYIYLWRDEKKMKIDRFKNVYHWPCAVNDTLEKLPFHEHY